MNAHECVAIRDEGKPGQEGGRPVADYISNMGRVDGWLSESDAECFVHVDAFQKANGIDGHMIEIGVWHGRGAILFHHLLREDEKVYAVDLFDLRDRAHPFFNDPARLREHARAFGCDDRLEIVCMDTVEQGHKLPDMMGGGHARVIHIDGGHDYEVVRRDIEITRRLLGDGAVLVFDDFFNPKHPGTTQAIMEFMALSPDHAAFLMTRKKLWVCGSSWYKPYFKSVKAAGIARHHTGLFHRRVLQTDGARVR